MDTFLYGLSLAVLALTVIIFVGGSLSFVWDSISFAARREAVWATFHQPRWDKEGNVVPKHLHCLECELEVEKAGGELEGHSTLE